MNENGLSKCFITGVLFLLIFFSFVAKINAKVVINEFASATSDDWIELYSDETVNLNGWVIKDSVSVIKTLGSDNFIEATMSSFLVVDVGNRLNKDGDEIKLFKSGSETPEDSLIYGNENGICSTIEGQSIGRIPDFGGSFNRLSEPTKGSQNNSGIVPCPTSTPTLTPTPTSTPVPTKTLNATHTPTPTRTQQSAMTPAIIKTKTPTRTPNPTIQDNLTPSPVPTANLEDSPSPAQVLGAKSFNTATPLVKSKVVGFVFPIPYFLIATGAVLIVYSFIKSYRLIKKELPKNNI